MDSFNTIRSIGSRFELVGFVTKFKDFLPGLVIVGEASTIGLDQLFVNELLSMLVNELKVSLHREI
jgi:hypothetical protein